MSRRMHVEIECPLYKHRLQRNEGCLRWKDFLNSLENNTLLSGTGLAVVKWDVEVEG